jgi:hypothetical protein
MQYTFYAIFHQFPIYDQHYVEMENKYNILIISIGISGIMTVI